MDQRSGPGRDRDAWRRDAFQDDLSQGGTVLVASAGDPTRHAVELHALCEYGSGDDTAFVVTTTRSAATTLETYDSLAADG